MLAVAFGLSAALLPAPLAAQDEAQDRAQDAVEPAPMLSGEDAVADSNASVPPEELDQYGPQLSLFEAVCENEAFVPWSSEIPGDWFVVDKTNFLDQYDFRRNVARFYQVVFARLNDEETYVGFAEGVPLYSGRSGRSRTCSVYFKTSSLALIQSALEEKFEITPSSESTHERYSFVSFAADPEDTHYQSKRYWIQRDLASGWTQISTALTCSDKPRPSAFKSREGERKCPAQWY